MKPSAAPQFNSIDHLTWKKLFERQTPLRDQQMIPEFSQGLKLLGIEGQGIPDLNLVNDKLKALTGWQGVFVQGLEDAVSFFKMLSEKKFPIGAFIRHPNDLSYTPEPDIFHDLYGHLPFYTIPAYADFCEDFGKRALKYSSSEKIIQEFQRFFWFTAEFALVQTPQGLRIFGAGIASSFDECAYALSQLPSRKTFNIEEIRRKDFRIDQLQDTLYVLNRVEDLYCSLDLFEQQYLTENANTRRSL